MSKLKQQIDLSSHLVTSRPPETQGQFIPPPTAPPSAYQHPPFPNQGAFEGARQGSGQHQAAFQHTPQMQPFQQPNMQQQPYMMHDPTATPMAMTGPGINWPGPMHPQQPIQQQPPWRFTPGYGHMQQMPMGVVGPNVEYNQTPSPIMPPPYQQMHASNQADRQYPPWRAMPVEDGFANNPARLMQRQPGMQVNQMPPPGWVPPYPPRPAVPSQAPGVHGSAAQVYPPGQSLQPVFHQQHQPQPVIPNQHHVVPRPEGDPPLSLVMDPPPGHRHSHPGALLSHHHRLTLHMHAPWTLLPIPKLKDFGGASPAARALHRLNPNVPLPYACRFVHMYQTRFANDWAALKMLSDWCQALDKSTLTPQQVFENICMVLSLNCAWYLRDMLNLHNPAFQNGPDLPPVIGLFRAAEDYQVGDKQNAHGQSARDQGANAKTADDQAGDDQAANAQAADTQATNAQSDNDQGTEDQGANTSISSPLGNGRVIIDLTEAEGNSAREAIRQHTEEPEHSEDQEIQQGKLLVKLPVRSPSSTASPRGKKRASKHNDDEHEDVEGADTPDPNAVDKPMTKKQKKERPVSSLKASDLTEQESSDQSVQDEIDSTKTLHLSGSAASQDSDTPTPRPSKQSRQRTQKRTRAAAARRQSKRNKLANMPADQVPHVGPIFPSRRAILARDSRPYIHSICGHAFKHVEDVKSHHYGNASKMVGCLVIRAAVAQDGRGAIAEFPAWDTHESCKVGYSDIQYTQTKDGFVFLDQESWDKVQRAIDAGEGYKRKLEDEFDDIDAGQYQGDDLVADENANTDEKVGEEGKDDDTKNIDPFLLSSEAELGWKFPATHAYAPQSIGNHAPASNTPEKMRKESVQADSQITGTTMLYRGPTTIPIMDKPPPHLNLAGNTSLHGSNPMGQPANYQMPGITQPNPTQPPTFVPTKPSVPKRKVVKAGWDEKDEHDEEKLRAAALELKMRSRK